MSKKYVITDPSYILPREMWDACLNACEQYENDSQWSDMFNKEIENALKDYTQGQAFVESTGFGDWNNTLYGPNIDGIGAFAADAGMVCVCEYTGRVSRALGNLVNNEVAAVFEADGPITVDFDTSDSDWTIVEIRDSSNNYWMTHDPHDEDEEESD